MKRSCFAKCQQFPSVEIAIVIFISYRHPVAASFQCWFGTFWPRKMAEVKSYVRMVLFLHGRQQVVHCWIAAAPSLKRCQSCVPYRCVHLVSCLQIRQDSTQKEETKNTKTAPYTQIVLEPRFDGGGAGVLAFKICSP